MSKKSDRESKKAARRKTSAAATKKRPPRRTRMLALEPRMLFDGALGIDLGAKATAALQGDASAPAETTAPAAPQAQAGATVPGAGAAPEKSAVEKTAERLGLAPEAAPVRNEIVFVDSTVEGHQTLLAGLNPNATVVMLDASRDALDQMADYMDGRRDVDAVHIISHGSAGNLILAGQTYSADRLSKEYATDLARIGHALSAEGDILLYGCDVGAGSAGERFIETLSGSTGADIAASVDKTGAANLGGDWVLEVKTGQVETAVAVSLGHQWDFLLTAPPINVGGATLDFDGANRTLVSGVAGTTGAVYRYTDVATINGVQIDAYVTITGMTNATLVNIDNDAPASYVPPAGTTAVNVFAPEVSVTAANGKVDFAINFKDPNGNNLTLLNFYNNSLDIDGGGGFQEFVEYGGFKSVTTGNPTDLVISSSPGNDRLRFTGTSAYGGLIVNDVGRVQANFDAVSTLQISMGATGNTGGLRQYGSLFSAVSFGNPVTLTAPTSDLVTTTDTTPILTGSVGAAALGGGETFSVTVNGTTYTTANGLGISGTTWSLELPTALASGQYDVRAVRSAGALDIADQTQLELTVNDAPTLADTALTLTVGEDAPAPTGAVGSPVSAFTGGISDVNPSAAKGIAIVGTVETNGTWYYTTNGGTTWTAVNQIDGAVSANNALLLADNANTRLYFRPNADFSGSAPGALTLRAWDTTSGTAGTKVDPGAGGGALAFSTASDVIDVTVTPAADAPVNTVPGAQGTPINTSLEFSVLNGNALSVADVDGNLSTARVTVTNGVVNVTLAGGATISAGANGTNTLTISGTQAAINATLEGLRYTPTAGYTGAATLTLLSTDSSAQTDSDVVNITVAALANVPRIDLDAGSTNDTIADNLTSGGYAGSSGSVNLWTGNWVENDPEGAPQSAVAGDVRVTAGEIVLGDPGANNPAVQAIARGVDLSNHMGASLSFDYDRANLEAADTMVVEVSTNGGASYTALVTYPGNTAVGPKTISLAGYETDNTLIRFRLTTNFDATENVQIDNVVITAQPTGFTNTFTEGGAAVPIAQTDSAITDPNGVDLAGATIRIAGNYQSGADVLTFTNQLGITGAWNAATGTLTLTGNTTAANYSTAIEAIRFSNTSDAPSTAARTITVVVRDTTNATSNTARATITVVGANDAPVGVNDAATAIEAGGVANATPGLNPTGNVLTNDTDVDPGDTKTVSAITGGAVGVAKAGSYGSIVLNANGSYTYTVDNSNAAVEALRSAASTLYDTFTYTVRDTAGATSTATLTITIQGANDTATIGTPSVAVVTEDVGVSGGNLSATGSIAISDVDDHGAIFSTIVVPVGSPLGALVLAANGTYTYTVSNAAVQSLGAGQTAVDTFTVTSADGTTRNVSFTINGANDAPAVTSAGTGTFAENAAGAVYTATRSDVDGGDTVSWTLTGADAGLFTIDALTGVVTLVGAQNFETPGDANADGVYEITVRATDAGGLFDQRNVQLTLTNVNEAPAVTSAGTGTFAENAAGAVYTATRSDVDGGDTVSWTLTGADAGLFTIDALTGVVTLVGAQNFETPGDANADGVYEITVRATDAGGLFDQRNVQLTLTNVNEAPAVTSAGTGTFAENAAGAVYTATRSDVDGGDTVSWTLTGADAGLFTIDALTGVVTLVGAQNFETPGDANADGVYEITVRATDAGGLFDQRNVQLTLTNVNEAPAVTSAGTGTFAENAAGAVYTATRSDVDGGDTVSWTLTGADAGLFTIDALTGVVTLVGAQNFETPGDANADGVYEITVRATDAGGLFDQRNVQLTLTNVNEAPAVTSAGTGTFAENAAGAVYTATRSDVDGGDTVSWTLTGADAGLFTIDALTGVVTLVGAQNFETPGDANADGVYEITVRATDAGGLFDQRNVQLTLTNVNEAPAVTSAGTGTFAENAAGAVYTATRSDVDGGDTVSWTLTGADAGLFTIDALTGVVTLVGAQNFETPGDANADGVYEITVRATDAGGLFDQRNVQLTLTNVNEAPAVTSAGTGTFAENAAGAVYTATRSDVDGGDTVSWTLTGADAGLFTIDALTGVVTLVGAQNFETPGDANADGVYEITVRATDAGGLFDQRNVQLTLTNVNEAPAVTSAGTGTFAENAAGAVYTATRSDVDGGDTVSWTLTGADAGLFTIDALTGVVTLVGAQNFETPGDANADGVYEITVRATDAGGLFDQRNVQLSLTDAAVAPAVEPANPMAGQSAPPPPLPTVPASQPALPDFAPRVPQPADRPLGLPVDVATPASNLGGAARPAATAPSAPGIADLNALPPTGAGPTATFGLVRLSVLDAGSHLRLTGAILQHDAGGHHLFVYHGVPDMRLLADNSAVLRVPGDAFAHTDPAARVYLEARLANGAPLPGWLKFDGLRGVFSGTPPEGVDGTLEVEVVARDTEGREARTKFALEIEELRAQAAAAGLALGLDVDKEEAEKVRQELARQAHKAHLAEQARAATAGVRPSKPGAASFSDQVSAAKTQRDPLLERINPSGKDKTGSRR